MKKYILFLAVIGLISCHNPRRLGKKKDPKVEQTETTNMRLIVSFISIGSGTDGEARKQLDAYLGEYQTKNKVSLDVKMTKWGREGEIDYCFKLSELKDKEQSSFIKEVQDLLKNSTLVRYTENSPCK